MNDAEQIKAMRLQAQRLQDDGAHNAAQSMRDGADRLEALTQPAQAPNTAAPERERAYVTMPDGGKMEVVQFGDLPRLKADFNSRGPLPGTDYEA